MSEPVTAKRPRFPIGKILTLLFALFLISIFVGHALWTRNGRVVLDRQLAALREKGEPMAATDFVETPIADELNIVPLIQRAKLLEVESKERSDRETDLRDKDQYAFMQPLTEAEASLLRESTAANRSALDVLADADKMAGRIGMTCPRR